MENSSINGWELGTPPSVFIQTSRPRFATQSPGVFFSDSVARRKQAPCLRRLRSTAGKCSGSLGPTCRQNPRLHGAVGLRAWKVADFYPHMAVQKWCWHSTRLCHLKFSLYVDMYGYVAACPGCRGGSICRYITSYHELDSEYQRVWDLSCSLPRTTSFEAALEQICPKELALLLSFTGFHRWHVYICHVQIQADLCGYHVLIPGMFEAACVGLMAKSKWE